jgi:hypothetical protein
VTDLHHTPAAPAAIPPAVEPRDEVDDLAGPWHWIVPLLGVIFVALVVVSISLTASNPDSSTSGVGVIAYFRAHRAQQITAAVLTLVAIPTGLFFFGLLRTYLSRSRAVRPIAAIGFAGAILFAAGGCLAAGMQLTLSDVPDRLAPAAAQALNVLNNDLNAVLVMGGISALQFGYGIAILRTKLLPEWLGWVSIAFGVLALAGPIGFFALPATGLWILVVSVLIYERTAHRTALNAPAGPPAG